MSSKFSPFASKSRMVSMLVIFLGLLHVASPEVWVAVEQRLETSGQPAIPIANASLLTGLTAVPGRELEFYTSDLSGGSGSGGATLYHVVGNNVTVLFQDAKSSYFESIAYSAQTSSVYFTSPNRGSIFRLNEDGEVKIIYTSTKSKPSGLAIDQCTGNIYWTNTERGNPSIQFWRENQDEDKDQLIQSTTLISANLSKPRGISVDVIEGKLYWTDKDRSEYRLWRANLDGSDAGLVCSGRGGEPFALAVTDAYIYWTDWAGHRLWRVAKYGNCSVEEVSRFRGAKPNGISYLPEKTVKCDERHVAQPTASPSVNESEATPNTHVVFPGGDQDQVSTMSTISKHNSSCTNTGCLHGFCNLEVNMCECEDGWEGDQCEINVCHNYCLHPGANCIAVEARPICFCPPGVGGERCEKLLPLILPAWSPVAMERLSISFMALSAILAIVVFIMSCLLYRLRHRKPRIVRKRFISVSKGNKSGGNRGLPTEDGIQFDIEDCCDMTLCDTPCFEPPNRTLTDPADHDRRGILRGGACGTRPLLNSNCGTRPLLSPSKSKASDKRSLLSKDGNDDLDLF